MPAMIAASVVETYSVARFFTPLLYPIAAANQARLRFGMLPRGLPRDTGCFPFDLISSKSKTSKCPPIKCDHTSPAIFSCRIRPAVQPNISAASLAVHNVLSVFSDISMPPSITTQRESVSFPSVWLTPTIGSECQTISGGHGTSVRTYTRREFSRMEANTNLWSTHHAHLRTSYRPLRSSP